MSECQYIYLASVDRPLNDEQIECARRQSIPAIGQR